MGQNINKSSLISAMHEYSGKTKSSLEEYMDILLEVIKQEVAKGNRVFLRDFGSFEIVKHKERNRINPKTNEIISIPTHNVVRFKPGENFKSRVSK